ncbi:aldose 1-epimerase [Aeromicrobium sp. A1-2]|uniref:aldose 1-epimerase n=1 Tax=Aeromicrobium sp. A1-2 TaxID=2107713 RepID=UPI0013C32CCC|nr:aldose 1-epimerase [Aeromicrobium sp. A1-2]
MTDVLENDRVRAVIDPGRGARLVSLELDGHEVLGRATDPSVDPAIADGCFPMVPWAGRIRDGVLLVGGAEHQLPLADDGNALHGLAHAAAWQSLGEGAYELAIGPPWPTEGVATLTYALLDDGLRIELSWDDDSESPCSVGLHPWFRRQLDVGEPAVWPLDAGAMVERGNDGLPTGRLTAPHPGPWDDCFRLSSAPVITWPGALELTLSASTPWWVVYDVPETTVCLEPQTAPPDAFGHPGLQPTGGWPRGVWLELRGRAL